jgi:hypothetical protein
MKEGTSTRLSACSRAPSWEEHMMSTASPALVEVGARVRVKVRVRLRGQA